MYIKGKKVECKKEIARTRNADDESDIDAPASGRERRRKKQVAGEDEGGATRHANPDEGGRDRFLAEEEEIQTYGVTETEKENKTRKERKSEDRKSVV